MNGHTHTLLAIDDDADDLLILGEALAAVAPGARLLTAANGVEGLEQLRRLLATDQLPCLIVLDVNMPVLDGRETFMALKRDPVFQAIPLVVFSTSSSLMDKTFFQSKGAEFITKPVKYDQLLRITRHILSYCKE